MKTPKIGRPVRGSTTNRPIMVAFDLLGRRATLRLLWELRNEPLNFRALTSAADTNPSLLNTRLKELRAARLVQLGENGYALTREGRDLIEALQPLLKWAARWGKAAAG